MRHRAKPVTGLVATVLLWTGAVHAVVLAGSDASGQPGETVELAVLLDTGGDTVAGVQNDLEISAPLHLESRDDCAVNPSIGKMGAFAVAPCESGDGCTRVRAVILALDNVDPIPDGSVLYRCQLTIDAAAANGLYRVPVTNGGASDPEGNPLPAEGLAGRVAVGEHPDAVVQVDNVEISAGSFGTLRVRYTGFVDVATVSNDITLSDVVHITSDVDDQPACSGTVDGATAHFEFLPSGCSTVLGDCAAVRASISASVPLPLAEPLYECDIFPSPVAAPGSYVINCPSASGTGIGGESIDISCQSATLVLELSGGTPTPTRTGDRPTATPTLAAATPTFTGAVVRTATPQGDEDGSCQLVPPSRAGSVLPLLGPALLLAWRARRGRRVARR